MPRTPTANSAIVQIERSHPYLELRDVSMPMLKEMLDTLNVPTPPRNKVEIFKQRLIDSNPHIDWRESAANGRLKEEFIYAIERARHATEVAEVLQHGWRQWGRDGHYQPPYISYARPLVYDEETTDPVDAEGHNLIDSLTSDIRQHGRIVVNMSTGIINDVQRGNHHLHTPSSDALDARLRRLEDPNVLIVRAAGNQSKPDHNTGQQGLRIGGFANVISIASGRKAPEFTGENAELNIHSVDLQGDFAADGFTAQEKTAVGTLTSFIAPTVTKYAKTLMDLFPDVPSHYIVLAMLLTAKPRHNDPRVSSSSQRAPTAPSYTGTINAAGLPFHSKEGCGYLHVPTLQPDEIRRTETFQLLDAWRNSGIGFAPLRHHVLRSSQVERVSDGTKQLLGYSNHTSLCDLSFNVEANDNPLGVSVRFNLSDDARQRIDGRKMEIFLKSPQGTLLRLKSPGINFNEGILSTKAFAGESAKGSWALVIKTEEALKPSDVVKTSLEISGVERARDVSHYITPPMLNIAKFDGKFDGHVAALPLYQAAQPRETQTLPSDVFTASDRPAPELRQAVAKVLHNRKGVGRYGISLFRHAFTETEAAAIESRYRGEGRLSPAALARMLELFDVEFIEDLSDSVGSQNPALAKKMKQGAGAIRSVSSGARHDAGTAETLEELSNALDQVGVYLQRSPLYTERNKAWTEHWIGNAREGVERFKQALETQPSRLSAAAPRTSFAARV